MYMDNVLDEIRVRLDKALGDGKFDEIVRLGRIAKDWEGLSVQEKQILERKNGLLAALRRSDVQEQGSPESHEEPQREREAISPQQRGNSARTAFVKRLASVNVSLTKVAAKRYRTRSGLEVGIAYARELSAKPDFWFLGLADEHFDLVVLLCETASSQTLEFVLPPQVVKEIWSILSRSPGQVKFHVSKSGPTYELRIPGGSMRPINEYLGNKSVIK